MKIYCKNCRWYNKDSKICRFTTSPLFRSTTLNHKGDEVHSANDKIVATYIAVVKAIAAEYDDQYSYRYVQGDKEYLDMFCVHCTANISFKCPFYERKIWLIGLRPKRGPKHILWELQK